jgi:ParB-like chromosome segregation protein Spo0J
MAQKYNGRRKTKKNELTLSNVYRKNTMIIEKKKISDLIPAPYNPRQSTAKQEKHLKESLEKFGLVEPIIFNKQTGYIVGGHFRVRELKKLGIK